MSKLLVVLFILMLIILEVSVRLSMGVTSSGGFACLRLSQPVSEVHCGDEYGKNKRL